MNQIEKYLQSIIDKNSIDKKNFDKVSELRTELLDFFFNLQKYDKSFPLLFENRNTIFGAFARKTEIENVKRVNVILCLTGIAHYKKTENQYQIFVDQNDKRLSANSKNGMLNSNQLLLSCIAALKKTNQFQNVQINRNELSIDAQKQNENHFYNIVPAFFTDENFYLIPNTENNFQSFFPGAFQLKLSKLKELSNEKIYDIIKLMKIWFKKLNKDSKHLFLLENIIIDFYEKKGSFSSYLNENIIELFESLALQINQPVYDCFNKSKNINTLSLNEKEIIKKEISFVLENQLKEKNNLSSWEKVFT